MIQGRHQSHGLHHYTKRVKQRIYILHGDLEALFYAQKVHKEGRYTFNEYRYTSMTTDTPSTTTVTPSTTTDTPSTTTATPSRTTDKTHPWQQPRSPLPYNINGKDNLKKPLMEQFIKSEFIEVFDGLG